MRFPGIARLGVAAVAGVLALVPGGAAWAASTISLNPAHAGSTAAGFPTQDCNDPYPGRTSTEDGWHFVVPASTASDFVSMTLQFSTPGGPVTVGPITSADPANPSTGTGWSGYFDNAGAMQKHAYVTTDAGWTLLSGTATVDPDGATGTFNLSHTCPGTPTTTSPPRTTPPPGTTPPATTGTTPGRKPSGGVGTGGGGTQTAQNGLLLGLGALALAGTAGLGLVVARRRRDAA